MAKEALKEADDKHSMATKTLERLGFQSPHSLDELLNVTDGPMSETGPGSVVINYAHDLTGSATGEEMTGSAGSAATGEAEGSTSTGSATGSTATGDEEAAQTFTESVDTLTEARVRWIRGRHVIQRTL